MYSHCTYKIIASGNNPHSEPANCPNFINPTLDPRSPCSNSLAWLLHHGSSGMECGKANAMAMSGSCRHGLPCHTAGKAGALFSTRGVKKLSERLGSLQRTELPWTEMLGLTCLASLSAHWRDGYAPRDQTNHPVQLPGELAPLISLQTREINHTGLDPKQDGHTTILISATRRV